MKRYFLVSQSLLIQGRFQLMIMFRFRKYFLIGVQVAIPSDSGQVSTYKDLDEKQIFVSFGRNPF